MTKFKHSLHLTDVSPSLDPARLDCARKVCRARRQRCREGLVLHDWRETARRYLRLLFPKAWVYRGGQHVAVHASPPNKRGQAGRVLFRVIEINNERDALACMQEAA